MCIGKRKIELGVGFIELDNDVSKGIIVVVMLDIGVSLMVIWINIWIVVFVEIFLGGILVFINVV